MSAVQVSTILQNMPQVIPETLLSLGIEMDLDQSGFRKHSCGNYTYNLSCERNLVRIFFPCVW